MNKDLTTSKIHRKNILNNKDALDIIYKEVAFEGVFFEGAHRFTKKQVADFFEIDARTVDRYLERYKEEFSDVGYEILRSDRLQAFKKIRLNDIPVVDLPVLGIPKNSPSIGVFTFKAFLNMGMLLNDSEKAKLLRALILDIVIDAIHQKLGGSTKYINQREEEFLSSALREHNYRKAFTDALDAYVVESKFKYAQLTNKVYVSIFHENAKEYRQILKLSEKENVRATMYSEVLDLIASYENGFANCLKKNYEEQGEKLSLVEANQLFDAFEEQTDCIYEPLREKVRALMASRDMAFRDALHEKLKDYITHLSSEDFDKFLGEKSMSLEERIERNIEVFKRLKDR